VYEPSIGEAAGQERVGEDLVEELAQDFVQYLAKSHGSEAGGDPTRPGRGQPAGGSPAKRRQGDPGLVKRVISRQDIGTGLVEVRPGGMICKFDLPAGTTPAGWRGPIKGFSRRSKRRLMEQLIGVELEPIVEGVGKRSVRARGAFDTLTYPAEYSANWRDWKRDLEVLRKRMERRWPLAFGVWKEEFQERGAPHFHILTVFKEVVDLPEFRQWVSQAWYEIVGSGDPKHLAAGTNVRPLYGPVQRLLRYLIKYLGKVVESDVETGRIWGKWGKVPCEVLATVQLRWAGWVELQRRVRKWGKKSGYLRRLTSSSFLLLGEGGALAGLLRGLDGARLEASGESP